jgi:transcriptional regulator with XRE-family HTH domain
MKTIHLNNPAKSFTRRMRWKRQQLGWTQEELAYRARFSDATISSYELGITFPPIDRACDIAEALGVSIFWLLGLDD